MGRERLGGASTRARRDTVCPCGWVRLGALRQAERSNSGDGRSAAGLVGNGEFDPGARLDAEVGYGLGGMGGLLTPYGGMSVSERVQTYRVGSRFRLGE